MNGGFLVSAMGITLLFAGISAKSKYAPSKWKKTTAEVINSYPRRIPSQFAPLFIPHIEYSYTVGAHSFKGNTYAYSSAEDRNGLEEIKKLLEAYRTGGQIDIWFRIDRPSISCIKFSSAYSVSQMHALILAGVILLSLGLSISFCL